MYIESTIQKYLYTEVYVRIVLLSKLPKTNNHKTIINYTLIELRSYQKNKKKLDRCAESC